MKDKIKKAIDFIKDTDIDIRIRLLYLVEFAILIACIVGTATMLLFTTTIYMLIPNFILLILSIVGLHISFYKKKYEMAIALLVIGCAYIALPFMFFTAGGNKSGMIIWFLFGVIVACVITKGKHRIVMPVIMTVISCICMLIGYYHPEYVTSLENESAEFFDEFQSFIVVSLLLLATLTAYLNTYDRQSKKLEEQREEMRLMACTDSLTGLANRYAYYDDINALTENGLKEDLAVLAMDLNGLKKVNDTQGHADGDAFIKCAADVITAAYAEMGKVYRIGGDEFMAIISCPDDKIDKLPGLLDDSIRASGDKMSNNMSIALGIASCSREKGKTFIELERLADSRMYQNKGAHYRQANADRRKS